MNVYAFSKRYIILVSFPAVAGILGLLYYLILYGFSGALQQPATISGWFLPGLAIVGIGILCYLIVDAVKRKFVIESDRIFLINPLGIRELLPSEIKGYRVGDRIFI